MRIVDSHIHFWDIASGNYPWLETPSIVYSGDNRHLPGRYDPTELRRDAGDLEVVATVHVEANPRDPIREVKWLDAIASADRGTHHPSGIVAYTDLSRSDALSTLGALARYPRVRGIRQILNRHRDPYYNYVDCDYLADATWLENLHHLQRFGWSFDLQIYPAQANAAAAVIRCHPEIVFIVNHAGMLIDRRSVIGWRQWRAALRELALCPNVVVKISGLAMFDHHWTIESFRPLVLEVIDIFGADRCMFASNSPIDRLHASYATLWEGYAEIASVMTQKEVRDLFVNNALRLYRLTP